MATKIPFLQEKNDQVIFTGYKLEIYLPKVYFDQSLATEVGADIDTIGIFPYRYIRNEDEEKKNSGTWFQLSLPETIRFSFVDQTEIPLKLGNAEEEPYIRYTLEKGSIFMYTVYVTQSVENLEKVVGLHHQGKIPPTTKYSEIVTMYMDSMSNNKSDLRMPMSLIEIIISELARDPKDLDKPFRQAIGRKNASVTEYDFAQINILDLAMRNSTFTAITSQDMNQAILRSVNKGNTDGVERYTPIEKTIKY